MLGTLADGPIGVTEVAERTSLPKSTAARLLASLARVRADGADAQDQATSRREWSSMKVCPIAITRPPDC